MIRTKSALKAIGLCVLALGMMAFAASAAQAEAGSAWDVNGVTVTEPSSALEGEAENAHLVLHVVILNIILIEILCTGDKLVNMHLNANGSITEGAQIRFSGCVFIAEGEELEACEPTAAGTEAGVIVTEEGHGLLVLHEGEGIVEVLPDEGEIFAYVETGEECAFGEKIPVGGKLTLKDCEGRLTVSQSTHLVEEGPLSSLWVLSEESPATTIGSTNISLAGGASWSGLPN